MLYVEIISYSIMNKIVEEPIRTRKWERTIQFLCFYFPNISSAIMCKNYPSRYFFGAVGIFTNCGFLIAGNLNFIDFFNSSFSFVYLLILRLPSSWFIDETDLGFILYGPLLNIVFNLANSCYFMFETEFVYIW